MTRPSFPEGRLKESKCRKKPSKPIQNDTSESKRKASVSFHGRSLKKKSLDAETLSTK